MQIVHTASTRSSPSCSSLQSYYFHNINMRFLLAAGSASELRAARGNHDLALDDPLLPAKEGAVAWRVLRPCRSR